MAQLFSLGGITCHAIIEPHFADTGYLVDCARDLCSQRQGSADQTAAAVRGASRCSAFSGLERVSRSTEFVFYNSIVPFDLWGRAHFSLAGDSDSQDLALEFTKEIVCLCRLTSRRSQRRLALSVPLRGSRFLIRRGSAFFVRPLYHYDS